MKSIRIDKAFLLPTAVKHALDVLDDAGHLAYLVGGSVRDYLLGRESKDHDIATSATPDEICELFPDSITVGKAFGVIKVPIAPATPDGPVPEPLEIATFRRDLDYQDYRHPTGVLFSGPAEDASRRDFTINGLFLDPKGSRILDFVGGLDDLKAGVIRAIGEPDARFREDALRLLRAIRFRTALGFSLDPTTEQAIATRARLVSKVSHERIFAELSLMFTGPRPALALEMITKLGVLGFVLPELDQVRCSKNVHVQLKWKQLLALMKVMEHSVQARGDKQGADKQSSDRLGSEKRSSEKQQSAEKQSNEKKSNTSAVLCWASVLSETEHPDRVAKVLERLRAPRSLIDGVEAVLIQEPRCREVYSMREATFQRFVRQPHFREILEFHRLHALATDGNLAHYGFCKAVWEQAERAQALNPSLNPAQLLSGEDLIHLGFKPGPQFSEILRTIEDLGFENKIVSKDQALEYVVKHFVR